MTPIDVKPEHLKIVQNILEQYVPKLRVVAFGSRVSGTARQTSDLDLCIMAHECIPFETLGNLRDEFSLSNLPYKVDVIDWSTISPGFRKIVSANSFDCLLIKHGEMNLLHVLFR